VLGYSILYLHPNTICFRPFHNAIRLLLGGLGHGVESATVLEPLDLALVEGVREFDVERLATVRRLDNEGHGLVDSELSALEVDLVVGADLVVVGGVGEGKRKHTLLLQVGLVLWIVSNYSVTYCMVIRTIRAKDRTMMARPPK
jgi:hypothetical protein